ncbi:MAG TPA: glycosyltransferase [Edaphocola sp.]|nr:glycosyltransferase [Edaphocola sp.]
MKKKVIIVSHNLRIGGVERSLIGLLNSIDYTRYEVDLFLFIHDGELLSLVPKEVNLLPENKKYKGLLLGIKENLKLGNFDLLIQKQIAKSNATNYIRKQQLSNQNLVYLNYLQKYALKLLPKINNQKYDLAISFLTPHFIASEKINAKKRIAWIHTDYSTFEFDNKMEQKMWSAYDYIASVSEDCSISFIKKFPDLKNKIILIENILHPNSIQEQSEAFTVEKEMPREKKSLIFCSVGRFTPAKNFDNVPFIARKMKEMGLDFKWYLIGFGGDEALIRSKIIEAKMENIVIILGAKENPYPYIKACDIYIQPSRFEGNAVTVREAQILCKPVVITKYATSASQLEDGFDGIIVPMDIEGCAKGIVEIVNNKDLQKQLIENCQGSSFGNETEIFKLERIIN